MPSARHPGRLPRLIRSLGPFLLLQAFLGSQPHGIPEAFGLCELFGQPDRARNRPASGPSKADTMSASENAANTMDVATPRSRAMGTASMAGR